MSNTRACVASRSYGFASWRNGNGTITIGWSLRDAPILQSQQPWPQERFQRLLDHLCPGADDVRRASLRQSFFEGAKLEVVLSHGDPLPDMLLGIARACVNGASDEEKQQLGAAGKNSEEDQVACAYAMRFVAQKLEVLSSVMLQALGECAGGPASSQSAVQAREMLGHAQSSVGDSASSGGGVGVGQIWAECVKHCISAHGVTVGEDSYSCTPVHSAVAALNSKASILEHAVEEARRRCNDTETAAQGL